MEREYCLKVPPEAAGERLDRFLVCQSLLVSRSQAQRLIEKGQVMVNSVPRRSSYRVQSGDLIVMQAPPWGHPQQYKPPGNAAYLHRLV
jgi:23S rRNA pseudouridine1911/1915/1917 synthase